MNGQNDLNVRLLTSPGDIAAALRLRQRAYAHHGHVPRCDQTEYRDAYDSYSTTALLGGFDGDRLVATMRLCFSVPGDGLKALPCAPYYPDLAALKMDEQTCLMEVCRLGIDPEVDNTSFRTTLYGFMVRAAYAAAVASRVHYIVVATRSDWAPYYKNLLGFRQIGEPAFYPPGDIPITLLAGNLATASKWAKRRNRFFHLDGEDISRMRRMLAPITGTGNPARAAIGDS